MGVRPADAVQWVIGRERVGPVEAGNMRGKAVIEEGTTGADRGPYGNNTGEVVCDAPLAPVERKVHMGRGDVNFLTRSSYAP